MVQVGNEVTHGMLWTDGKLPDNWDDFADYIRAGVKGVGAGCGTNSRPKIMIHIDQGGSLVSRSFFDENGNSLPVISVFDKYTRPTPRTAGQ
jgi:arabinogalactan endo-1,4-beta-galactosidase